MYWRWQHIPELADLPPDEQKRLWKKAMRDPLRATDALYVLALMGIATLVMIPVMHVPKTFSLWIGLPIFLAAILGVGAVSDALMVRRYRPVVRRLRGMQ